MFLCYIPISILLWGVSQIRRNWKLEGVKRFRDCEGKRKPDQSNWSRYLSSSFSEWKWRVHCLLFWRWMEMWVSRSPFSRCEVQAHLGCRFQPQTQRTSKKEHCNRRTSDFKQPPFLEEATVSGYLRAESSLDCEPMYAAHMFWQS